MRCNFDLMKRRASIACIDLFQCVYQTGKESFQRYFTFYIEISHENNSSNSYLQNFLLGLKSNIRENAESKFCIE